MDLYELRRVVAALQPTQLAQLHSMHGREFTATARGYVGELAVALEVRGAVVKLLPARWRREINNMGAGCDYGVDVITVETDNTVALWQVKRWRAGATVGYEVVAKLRDMAEGLERRGVATKCVLALWPGVAQSARQPVVYPVEEQEFSDDHIAHWMARQPAAREAADRTAHQAATVAAVLAAAARDPTRIISVRAPCGYGKSYIIALLVRELLLRHQYEVDGAPCIIVTTPRILVSQQLRCLLESLLEFAVPIVDGTRPWRHAPVVIVETQSSSKVPPGTMTALIRDEAHVRIGLELLRTACPRFELSATLSPADVVVCPREIWELGYICRPQFCCAVFDALPGAASWAQYFADHAEHQCVLVCCYDRTEAAEYAAVLQQANIGGAAVFVSQHSDYADLEAFRRGELRFLCVVSKVEMGIDIHRCDTVLFAYRWSAEDRATQLLGRGSRRHPNKSDYFHALFGASARNMDETAHLVTRITDLAVRALAPPPQDPMWLANHIEVRGVPAGGAAGGAVGGAAGGVAPRMHPAAENAAALVHRIWLDELGSVVKDHTALYRIDCQRMAQSKTLAGLPVFAEWEQCRGVANFLPEECRADPAKYYNVRNILFKWREFLGWPPLSATEWRQRFWDHMFPGPGEKTQGDAIDRDDYAVVCRRCPDLLPPRLEDYGFELADL